MASYRFKNMAITTGKDGPGGFKSAGAPGRFGKHSEITTPDYAFQFNLRGEIKHIRGLGADWPHPSEYLKRTDGNDWVFYSVSAVDGIIDLIGEYYLPCLPYPSNGIWDLNPYANPNLMGAFGAWAMLFADLNEMPGNGAPPKIEEFLRLAAGNDESALHEKSRALNAILGERISVLPPDTRHVDYQVIPLIIADGCRYHCDFCWVKSNRRFRPRTPENIREQIARLSAFYSGDRVNHRGLFLGNHDALGAGDELIYSAAAEALEAFGFEASHGAAPLLFLFGSVDTLLGAGHGLFEALDGLPFCTCINIGFESVDSPTLARIGKPLAASRVRDAFQKAQQLNRDHARLDITANFLLGESLPPKHYESLAGLLRDASPPPPARGRQSPKKGTVYLSPIQGSRNRPELVQAFFQIKRESRLPVYLYLIQRL